MKKLLTVISGMLLFACLTTGFIAPTHKTVTTTNNVNKANHSGTAPMFYRSQWKHTAFVNPWSAQKSFADPVFHVYSDFFWPADVQICKLTNSVNGILFDKQDDAHVTGSVPTGSYLTFEMQVASPYGGFIIYITNKIGQTVFYEDTGYYATHTWQAAADEEYYINIR